MAAAPPKHTVAGATDRPLERLLESDLGMVALLVALWLVPLLVIGVRGEFAENDGWAHAATTKEFLASGHVVRRAWTFAPIITNVILGGFFAKLFGFSFAALRASSVLMGGVGLLGVYALGRVYGVSRQASALASIAFAFGPLPLALSYTFMTDVPFAAFATLSLVAFVWGLERRRPLGYALGFAAAVLATLSRQPGVVLIVAFAGVLVLHKARTLRAWGIAALVGTVALVALLLVDRYVLVARHLSVTGALRGALLGSYPLFTIAKHGTTTLVCLGLASLPILLGLDFRRFLRPHLPVGLGIGAATLLAILVRFRRAPFGENMLDRGGIGPILMHCADHRPAFPAWVQWSLVVLAAAGGGISTAIVGRWLHKVAWPARFQRPALILLPLFGLLYLAPVLMRSPFFDRYLIPITPAWLVMLVLAGTVGAPEVPRRLALGHGFAIFVMALSTLATADYLNHLRLRSSLLDRLLKNGVAPALIEGGFEFDGQYRYGQPSALAPLQGVRGNGWLNERCVRLLDGGSGWRDSDRYVLSYCDRVPGFRTLATEHARRWLPPFEDRLYLHERAP